MSADEDQNKYKNDIYDDIMNEKEIKRMFKKLQYQLQIESASSTENK
jgi:hypothetical protein